MKELYYCAKCGNTRTGGKQCLICQGQDIEIVPKKYVSYVADVVPMLNDDLKEEFFEKVVKISSVFDPYWFEHKEEISQNMKQQYEKAKSFQKEQTRTPKCPSCGSSNISNIGLVSRVVSTKLFGLASSKIGKTHKCNNCGSMW